MIRARVIGAGGFGGGNIIELLAGHPEVQIESVVDIDGVGRPISDRHTHLRGFCDLPVTSPEQIAWDGSAEVVFCATPDGVGQQLARQCLDSGSRLIDYSGDFRFDTAEAYGEYARRIGRPPEHGAGDLLPETVYGLTELHRDRITTARLVGNPGCFAVAAILGLAPAVQSGLVDLQTLICDAKTGVSGAGIKPASSFHYPLRYENMNAYKIGAHQHIYEVERELGRTAGQAVRFTLTTQVVPLCRGIMATIYARALDDQTTEDELRDAYIEYYHDSAFVRVAGPGQPVSNNDVRGSNIALISVNLDPRTGQMITICHIDNLMKGQAGSALQNMNVMFGLEETAGLGRPPHFP